MRRLDPETRARRAAWKNRGTRRPPFAMVPGPGQESVWDEAPYPEFEEIRGHVAFYPGCVACWLGGVRVAPQAGDFYGGWVTPDVVGPFERDFGTGGW